MTFWYLFVMCHVALQKVIAQFQAVANKNRGTTVICLKPQYVLLNQTDWQLKACPLQLVPKVHTHMLCVCSHNSVNL